MSFRLTTIFWAFVVVASALAAFGVGGILLAVLVVGFWVWVRSGPNQRVTLTTLFLALAIIVGLVWLLLPAVQSEREPSQRKMCVNNLKLIALAVQVYHDAHGEFPPPYVADSNGKPMHSWRVLILPYVEETALFKKYNLNEPWDGPNNSKLAKFMPDVYRCPSQPWDPATAPETQYFAIIGPDTAWPVSGRRRFSQFSNRGRQTILLIEAPGLSVDWMEPRDLSIDEAISLLTAELGSVAPHTYEGWFTTTHYRNVAFCDGRVFHIGQIGDAEIARKLVAIGSDDEQQSIPPKRIDINEFNVPKVEYNWGRIYALATFIIVSLLPIWTKKRQVRKVETVLAGDA